MAFSALHRILVPLALPGLGAAGLLTFIGAWGDFPDAADVHFRQPSCNYCRSDCFALSNERTPSITVI